MDHKTAAYDLPQPLGTLSAIALQAALDRFGLGDLRDVSPANSGNFNQNAFLTTSAGEFVFRGAPHYDWQFPKERFFADLIAATTSVPVPVPYRYEASDALFGWPYVIMPRLSGESAETFASPAEGSTGWHDVARSQARMLAELHAPTFPHAGDFALKAMGFTPFGVTYAEWALRDVVSLTNATMSMTAQEKAWFIGMVKELFSKVDTSAAVTIVHGDFNYMNMVFAQQGDALAVTGVFDLMTATLGDPVADLSRQTAMYLEAAPSAAAVFVTSYLRQVGWDWEQIRPRMNFFMAHERLIVRDFAQRHGVDWIDWSIPAPEWFGRYMLDLV